MSNRSTHKKQDEETLREKIGDLAFRDGASNPDHLADQIMSLITERGKELYIARSDVAWCLGKLRGLGYPNEVMEKTYGFPPSEEVI